MASLPLPQFRARWLTHWRACIHTQDEAAFEKLLGVPRIEGIPTPVWVALAHASEWALQALRDRGQGPKAWTGADWCGVLHNALRLPVGLAESEKTFHWERAWLQQEAALDSVGATTKGLPEPMFAALIEAAARHPSPFLVVGWIEKAQRAGVNLGSLVVRPGIDPLRESMDGMCATGSLMRVAWETENLGLAWALYSAGVRLDEQEPTSNEEWARPGWSLAGRLEQLTDSPTEAQWRSIFADHLRAERLGDHLPAPVLPCRSKPRF